MGQLAGLCEVAHPASRSPYPPICPCCNTSTGCGPQQKARRLGTAPPASRTRAEQGRAVRRVSVVPGTGGEDEPRDLPFARERRCKGQQRARALRSGT